MPASRRLAQKAASITRNYRQQWKDDHHMPDAGVIFHKQSDAKDSENSRRRSHSGPPQGPGKKYTQSNETEQKEG